MAQLDFPANPSVDDTYTANGIVYTWDGTKWDGAISISGSSGTSDFSSTVTAPSYEADNTGTDTVLFDFQRNNASQFQITTEPAINVIQPLDLRLPDNSALPFRIIEGNNEYVRFKTTDGEEEIDFSKKLKIDGQIDINSDINILQPNNGQVDINIPSSDGNAFRIMSGTSELFRFSTNVGPEIADFTCAAKFDGAINVNGDVTMIQNECDVTLKEGSSNALDFVDAGTTALRFNTNLQQLITEYDYVNENNDSIIQLGGTTAAPLLKLVGDGTATFNGAITAGSTLTMGGNLLPASASIDIGTQSSKFNNLHINQINDTGDLVVSGDIFLGNNALDTISMRANIITSLSSSSSSNSIGSSTAPWGDIYTAKSVQAGIDSTSHTAHISMNEDGSLKLRNLTGLSQLTTTPSTGLLAMISNKLYIYIATGWKEVNLTTATPPS